MWVGIAWLVVPCVKARCEKTSIKDIFLTYPLVKRDKFRVKNNHMLKLFKFHDFWNLDAVCFCRRTSDGIWQVQEKTQKESLFNI